MLTYVVFSSASSALEGFYFQGRLIVYNRVHITKKNVFALCLRGKMAREDIICLLVLEYLRNKATWYAKRKIISVASLAAIYCRKRCLYIYQRLVLKQYNDSLNRSRKI